MAWIAVNEQLAVVLARGQHAAHQQRQTRCRLAQESLARAGKVLPAHAERDHRGVHCR